MSALIQGDTLKKCPFCGSEAETYYNGEDNVWQTACLNDDCGAIQFGMTNVCSERNWNIRTGSEWISVKDRLPSMSGKYIVCTKNGAVYVEHFYGADKGWAHRTASITHWMPLPAQPTPCNDDRGGQ